MADSMDFNVLVVDDTETNIDILVETLGDDYNVSVRRIESNNLTCPQMRYPSLNRWRSPFLPFQLDSEWFAVGTVRDSTQRKQAEKELKEQMKDMQRFSCLTIDREERMIELKNEVNGLLEQLGNNTKYKIVE
ncbi:hypothetical protein ACFL0H_00950 [Thermodesulfobacteriota bacterium]